MTPTSSSWLRLWMLACILCVGIALPGRAHANVVCSPTISPLNFGTVTVNTSSGAAATGTIGYTCTNHNRAPAPVNLCLDIGNPSYPGTAAQPLMQYSASTLAFQLDVDPALTRIWARTVQPLQTQFTIPGATGNGGGNNGNGNGNQPGTITGSFTFYGLIQANQPGAVAGTYNASFYNTLLGFISSAGGNCQSNVGDYSGQDFSLNVTATVGNACVVSASPLNLGTVNRSTGSAASSSSIVVKCPNRTPYNVGLLPSNGDVNGAGVMSGTGGNTDKVPYQLRSAAGANGPVWGNTVTSTSTGNGVSGIGSGSDQSLTVYATVNNTNFNADTYIDTVRVFVYY